MGDVRFSRSDRARWLTTGALAPHIDVYRRHLTDSGYAAGTIASCLSSLAHLSQWMHRNRIHIERINEALVAKFLDDHLPRCRCRVPVLRCRAALSAALGPLLVILRNSEAIAPKAVGTTPVDMELCRY